MVNLDRLTRYVGNGYGPPGWELTDAVPVCDGIADALGDETYRSPILDAAPWYDRNDPATWDFAGVFPLGITGAEGTTRTVTVTDVISDGGYATGGRRAPRPITVSALLLGRTPDGVDAGLRWLTNILHRVCDTDVCDGADLTMFTGCPSTAPTPNPALPLTDHELDGTTGGWLPVGGTWDGVTFTTGEGVVSLPGAAGPAGSSIGIIDGGSPTGFGTDIIDGGSPSDAGADIIDGGDPGDVLILEGAVGLIAGPLQDACLGWVEAVWDITTHPGNPVTVILGAADATGTELDHQPAVTVNGSAHLTYTLPLAPWDTWRPALWVSEPGADLVLTLRYRDPLSPDACLASMRRHYKRTVCTDGPTVVERFASDRCDTVLARVEWTWVALDPHRYGDPVQLLSGFYPTNVAQPTYIDPAVTLDAGSSISNSATACPPVPAVVDCFTVDPCASGFAAPPTPPVIAEDVPPPPANYHRGSVSLPATLIPGSGEAGLILTLRNDGTPKVGTRIRIWEEAGTPVECDYRWGFVVGYLDADATLTIDTGLGTAMVACGDHMSGIPTGAVFDARAVLRGHDGTPFEYPVLSCGTPYVISVDVGQVYPADCDPVYNLGDPQGNLQVDVALAVREG